MQSSGSSSPGHPWRLLALIAVVLSVWGLLDVRNRGMVDPHDESIHKTDFTVYTEAGAAFFDGRDPYSVTNPRGWGYLYLPMFAMLMAPLHVLRPETQVTVWFFLSLLTVAGCYFETVRLLQVCVPRLNQATNVDGGSDLDRRQSIVPTWLIWAAVIATALPAFNCLQRGQIGVLQLYLLLLGLRMVLEARTPWRVFLAGVVLALPITLKLIPVIPVGFVWLERLLASWRHDAPPHARSQATWGIAGTVAGLILTVLILPAAIVGWRANLEHLDQWWQVVGNKAQDPKYDRFAGDSYSVRNQSLNNAMHHLGNWADYQFGTGPYDQPFEDEKTFVPDFITDKPAFELPLLAARIMIMAMAGWVCLRTTQRTEPLALAAGFGLAGVATLIAAPIARGHYFVLLLPAVLFLPAWLLHEGRPRAARLLAWTPAVLILAHYALLNVVGRVGLLGNGLALWYVVAVGLFLQTLTERRPVMVAETDAHQESTGGLVAKRAERPRLQKA
jgi:hypothetical protein